MNQEISQLQIVVEAHIDQFTQGMLELKDKIFYVFSHQWDSLSQIQNLIIYEHYITGNIDYARDHPDGIIDLIIPANAEIDGYISILNSVQDVEATYHILCGLMFHDRDMFLKIKRFSRRNDDLLKPHVIQALALVYKILV